MAFLSPCATNATYFSSSSFESGLGNEFFDVIAPVIQVEDYQEGYIYNVKLGQKVTISYQVSDNVTPEEECRVAVMVTNMTSYETSYWNRSDQDEGFTLGEASFFIIEEGLHRVTVYCRDNAGNYTTITFNFMVKA